MLNGKLSFAIKSVVSGVRNVAADPVLTACSTEGKFSLTPAATKFMGIATGENVQFFNNIDAIEVAIDAKKWNWTPEMFEDNPSNKLFKLM